MPEARIAVVAMIVLIEVLYLFNCRSFGQSLLSVGVFTNGWMWLGAGLMLVFQLLFTYAPIMNELFHTQPLPAKARLRKFGARSTTKTTIAAFAGFLRNDSK